MESVGGVYPKEFPMSEWIYALLWLLGLVEEPVPSVGLQASPLIDIDG
jgi:hypothetical protein